jgi:EAL domain-containing protein (putative c-di-GMP-specific phosphodiesterase class I)
VREYFESSGRPWTQEGDVLSIEVGEGDLQQVVPPLGNLLSSTEQQDVRVYFRPNGQQLQLRDVFDVESLSAFAAKVESAWLINLLAAESLTSWFQPIVKAEDKTVFAYECLMRGLQDGQTVFPDRILRVAKGAGLLFQLDRAARLSSIRNAARFNLNGKIFINFTPTAIYDPRNCLQTTMRAVDECHLQREQIVFEVIESEDVRDVHHLRDILNFYRERGFEVALDDIGSGYSSLNRIAQIRPDYIKLDRELVSQVDKDPYQALIAAKLLETAKGLGITTIAEGVESEAEYFWLREHGADYVQGYYFARPAAEPPLLNSN